MKSNTVNCQYGKIQGIAEKDIISFFGIPYGKNNGRFMNVSKPDKWDSILDATKPRTVFPQLPSRLAAVMGTNEYDKYQSEDSFTLNIWTTDTERPKPGRSGAKTRQPPAFKRGIR